jgi:hypothetical protein
VRGKGVLRSRTSALRRSMEFESLPVVPLGAYEVRRVGRVPREDRHQRSGRERRTASSSGHRRDPSPRLRRLLFHSAGAEAAGGGSKRRVVSLLIWGELGGRHGVLWTIKDKQDENIKASEAAPARSRRSPARATDPGRATTPVPAASCRRSSSSLPYLLLEVQRHERYCSTHY